MRKKILSIMLAIALCVSLLPISAFAVVAEQNVISCICEIKCTKNSIKRSCPVCQNIGTLDGSMDFSICQGETPETRPIDRLDSYLLQNSTLMSDAKKLELQASAYYNGRHFTDCYYIETDGTDIQTLTFMTPDNEVFGVDTVKPNGQKKVLAAQTGGLKIASEGTFTNSATVRTGKTKVNSGFGEYSGALGITVEGGSSRTDKYSSYTITLKDRLGNTRNITLVVKSLATPNDSSLVAIPNDADVDLSASHDDGYVEFDKENTNKITNCMSNRINITADMSSLGCTTVGLTPDRINTPDLSQSTGNVTFAFQDNCSMTLDGTALASALEQQNQSPSIYFSMLRLEPRKINIDLEDSPILNNFVGGFEVNATTGTSLASAQTITLKGNLTYSIPIDTNRLTELTGNEQLTSDVFSQIKGYKVLDDGTLEQKEITITPPQEELAIATIFSDSNSTYILVYEPENSTVNTPKTGDHRNMLLYASLMVLAVTVFGTTAYKRKEQ